MSQTDPSGHDQASAPAPAPSDTPDDPAPRRVPNGQKSGLIASLSGLVTRLTGGKTNPDTLRESLEEVLEEHPRVGSDLAPEERLMITKLLGFGKLRVDDVMVPRADIIAVEEGASLEEVVEVFSQAGHSRLPVYRETLDEPLGMYHIKDVIPFLARLSSGEKLPPFAFAKARRPLLFVPPSMPVLDLLLKMQATRNHMSLVIDEYGGTDGLVTIEDIVEEIVGEIEDEHDEPEAATLIKRPDGSFEANARVTVDELEARFGLTLQPENEEEHVDTLGGLVVYTVDRVPERGEIVRHGSGLEFEILDADPRRLKKLRIRRTRRGPKARPTAATGAPAGVTPLSEAAPAKTGPAPAEPQRAGNGSSPETDSASSPAKPTGGSAPINGVQPPAG